MSVIIKSSNNSLTDQWVKNLPAMQETPVQFLGWEDPLEKGKDAHSSILGLPLCGSAGKESTCNAGDLSSIPELGRISMRRSWGASRRPGKHTPTHYSTGKVKVKVAQLCLTLCDPMDYTVHGILQARILEWVTFPFFRGSSQCRD